MNNYTQASDGPDEVVEQAQRTLKSIRQRKQARHVRCETLPTLPSTSRASSEPQTNLAQGIAETNMPLLNSTQAIQPTPAVVLSKITLPTFTGETFDWKRFYQLFMSTVDANVGLPDVAKLSYLVASLNVQAAQCVAGFDICNKNYRPVLERLKHRFGSDKQIARNLYKVLGENCCSGNTLADAINYADSLEAILLQMASQNLPLDLESNLLIIEKTLPAWIDAQLLPINIHNPDLNVTKLRAHLRRILDNASEKTVRTLNGQENTEHITTMQASKRNIKLNPRQGNIFKNSIKMITKGRPTRGRESPEKCQYCDGGHNSRDCTKFETPQKSSTRARERRLYFNCLQLTCARETWGLNKFICEYNIPTMHNDTVGK